MSLRAMSEGWYVLFHWPPAGGARRGVRAQSDPKGVLMDENSNTTSSSTPAGWYQHPGAEAAPGSEMYWDGSTWRTDLVRQVEPSQAQQMPPPLWMPPSPPPRSGRGTHARRSSSRPQSSSV
ncbi:hypothetical protein GCM10010459_00340 [Microbacterium schleiferi]